MQIRFFAAPLALVVALATTGCIHRRVTGDQEAGMDFVKGSGRCQTESMLSLPGSTGACEAKRSSPKTARR